MLQPLSDKLRRKKTLIFSLIIFELGLLFIANRYLSKDRTPEQREPATASYEKQKPVPLDMEEQAIQELETMAKKKSWADLETTRSRLAKGFLQSRSQPSRGVALYFFPETLPKYSFERDFASQELEPELKAMRTAFEAGRDPEVNRNYSLIRSRVRNYELGASSREEELSLEAQRFLGVYQEFTVPSP